MIAMLVGLLLCCKMIAMFVSFFHSMSETLSAIE